MERGLLIPFAFIPILLIAGTVFVTLVTDNPSEAYESLLLLDALIGIPVFLLDLCIGFDLIMPELNDTGL